MDWSARIIPSERRKQALYRSFAYRPTFYGWVADSSLHNSHFERITHTARNPWSEWGSSTTSVLLFRLLWVMAIDDGRQG